LACFSIWGGHCRLPVVSCFLFAPVT
jgi:hypothetical protein